MQVSQWLIFTLNLKSGSCFPLIYYGFQCHRLYQGTRAETEVMVGYADFDYDAKRIVIYLVSVSILGVCLVRAKGGC